MGRTPEVVEEARHDGTHALVVGRHRTCKVIPNGSKWARVTPDSSKTGRRYFFHATYAEAIAAALAWGNRKQREA